MMERQSKYLTDEISITTFGSRRFGHVGWGAVIAGVITAMSVQLFLSVLGSGIGLSIINPGESSPGAIGVGALAWWITSGTIAFFCGGWVAGRMANIPRRADGMMHGFITWGATALVSFMLLTTTLGAILAGGFSVLKSAPVEQIASDADLRPAVGVTGMNENTFNDIQRLVDERGTQGQKDLALEQMAIVTQDLGRVENQEARKRQIVAALLQNTSVPEAEAKALVNRWEANAQQEAENAKRAAEETSKTAGKMALFSALMLVLGAAAASIAGGMSAPHWSEEEIG